MTSVPFAQRDRRALIWGTAILLTAALGLRGLPAIVRWTHAQRERAERLSLAVADARIAERAGQWLSDSVAMRRERAGAMDALFLRGVGPIAAADLAGEISAVAEAVGVQMASLQVDPSADSVPPVRLIRARASISGDLDSVMQFVSLIETGPPMLAVREMSVTRRSGQGGARVVHMSLTIEGLANSTSPRSGTR
jgi:hypothetical protein